MKKVRKVRWHGVVRETLKAQASNFILDPRFNWKPVECLLLVACLLNVQWSVLSSDVALTCLGLRRTNRAADFVCAEVYSVCCQGDQQVEYYNRKILIL